MLIAKRASVQTRECNCARAISDELTGEKVVGAGGRTWPHGGCRRHAEHNGQAPCGPLVGLANTALSYLARSMGHGLGARGPVRNITAADRR